MRKSLKIHAFLILLLLVVLAKGDVVQYKFKSMENGTEETVKVEQGDQIEIEFDENTTAGYTHKKKKMKRLSYLERVDETVQ